MMRTTPVATKSAGTKRRPRKPRADGERTRAAILSEATALATLHGLEGLAIGRLAELTGMSKSGLFAHFGSKESLQLAVVGAAARVSYLEFIRDAMAADTPLERLWRLCEDFLHFVERQVFPGGCFFAAVASEMKVLPAPVRDRIANHQRAYFQLLTRSAEEAVRAGTLPADPDPEQLAFELHALIIDANRIHVVTSDPTALERAWTGVCARLGDRGRKRRRPGPGAIVSRPAPG